MTTTEFSQLRQSAGFTIEETAQFLGYKKRQIYRFENGEVKARSSILRSLRDWISDKYTTDNDNRLTFKFIDLFAGIGGLRLAFKSIGGRCVYSSEWDKYAVQTYAENFSDGHLIYGDITQIEANTIPDHDVLIAGFPCQPFSLAGVSKKNSLGEKHGFASETQGTLFFDIARILNEKRPKAFLLENVKNLTGHDKGRTFKTIENILCNELGYQVDYKVIDAQHFLPQHRERIAIVGFREEVGFSWDNLELGEKGVHKLNEILHPEDGSQEPEGHYTTGPEAKVSDKYILSDHLWQYLQEYAMKHKAKGNGFGFGLVTQNGIARTLSARYHKDGSEILIDRGEGKNPRRLTPRECARLMGFSDNFRIPVSDTQAYKQFGNSAAIPVFKEVARIMQPHIFSLMNRPIAYQRPFVFADASFVPNPVTTGI
tara:strand:+ start:257 stop:1540 length:1284 start_codon:yes stop_codon:yes gene_type:complete